MNEPFHKPGVAHSFPFGHICKKVDLSRLAAEIEAATGIKLIADPNNPGEVHGFMSWKRSLPGETTWCGITVADGDAHHCLEVVLYEEDKSPVPLEHKTTLRKHGLTAAKKTALKKIIQAHTA